MSIVEIIALSLFIWFFGGLAFFIVYVMVMDEGSCTLLDDRKGIAKLILWPITLVIFFLLAVVWIVKHIFDTILLGFWDYIKSLPKIIKEL